MDIVAADAVQDLLEGLLGDDYFELADFRSQLVTLAVQTCEGHGCDRLAVWTPERVDARVAELTALWNPPPELGGEPDEQRSAVSA